MRLTLYLSLSLCIYCYYLASCAKVLQCTHGQACTKSREMPKDEDLCVYITYICIGGLYA